jgi:hypothetical protein
MAWSAPVVGAMAHASNTNTTPLPLVLPTGIVAGHILAIIWTCATAGGATVSFPSGWTELPASRTGSGNTIRTLAKIADGTESGTTVNLTCSTNAACSAIAARAAGGPSSLSSIVHATASAGGSSGANIPRIPATTITEDDTLVFLIGCKNIGGSSISVPAGFTELAEGAFSTIHCMVLDYQIQTTATDVTSGTWTVGAGDASVSSAGLAVALIAGSGTTAQPVISSVDSDNAITGTQANVVIAGTGFGGSTGTVKLKDSSIASTCTVDSWSDTSIQIDVVMGHCRYGQRLIEVTTSTGLVTTKTITLGPPSGVQYVDLGTLRANTFDSRNKPERLYDSPDFVSGNQAEYLISGGTGTLTVDTDGRMQWSSTVTQMQYRRHNGTQWSAISTWDLRGLAPTFPGPDIPSLKLQRTVAMTALETAFRFADEDSTSGTYSFVGTPPTGVSINATTGQITGTATVLEVAALRVRRTDPDGTYVDSNELTLTVEEPPIFPIFVGTITHIEVEPNATFSLDLSPQFPFATSYVLNGTATGFAIHPTTGVLSGTGTTAGLYAGLTVTASNEYGSVTSNAFSIEVRAVTTTKVPRLLGELAANVPALLDAAGLKLGDNTTEFSDQYDVGRVSSQDPASDTTVNVGSEVDISVSLGRIPFVPPPVSLRTRRTVRLRTFLEV